MAFLKTHKQYVCSFTWSEIGAEALFLKEEK